MPEESTQEQYNEAYAAEVARLEAAEAAAQATTSTPEPKPAPDVVDTPADAPAATPDAPQVPDMAARVASLEKALHDTKAYATRNAQEVARLRKAEEERQRKASRPQFLDDNPELEEAIRHVAGPAATAAAPATEYDPDAWARALSTALPNLDGMLEQNPDFRAKAEAKAKELGDEWRNPLVAIREMHSLVIEHAAAATAEKARAQAAQDFAARAKKQTAMSVPGGSSARPPAPAATKDFSTMSDAEFANEQRRVRGF